MSFFKYLKEFWKDNRNGFFICSFLILLSSFIIAGRFGNDWGMTMPTLISFGAVMMFMGIMMFTMGVIFYKKE